MFEIEAKIQAICKKYDLTTFPNIRDNVMNILASAEPSKEEKLEAFDLYDEWLYEAFKGDERTESTMYKVKYIGYNGKVVIGEFDTLKEAKICAFGNKHRFLRMLDSNDEPIYSGIGKDESEPYLYCIKDED